jgi:hypothetical protein
VGFIKAKGFPASPVPAAAFGLFGDFVGNGLHLAQEQSQKEDSHANDQQDRYQAHQAVIGRKQVDPQFHA